MSVKEGVYMSNAQKKLPVFYTTKEFMKIFNISESTFWRWRKKGMFEIIRVGHKSIISESEVNKLLSESAL